jgi:hypothetical protein
MARRPREWPLRLAGSLFGLAAGALGLFTFLAPEGLTPLEHERAQGFGITSFLIGAVALLGSLASRDVHALWYCSPRRWRAFRADLLASDRPPGHAGGNPRKLGHRRPSAGRSAAKTGPRRARRGPRAAPPAPPGEGD